MQGNEMDDSSFAAVGCSNSTMDGMATKKTLYVGNIGTDIDEPLLVSVFGKFGACVSCKVIRDINLRNEPYAFIEMSDHNSALIALNAMNHINMMGRDLRVNWATTPGQGNRHERLQQGSHIFVGDLPLDTTDEQLMDAFKHFGPIIECKIVRHADGSSRGYAFVSFTNKEDAEKAIKKMDRSWLNSKAIKCNWATRKHQPEKKENTVVASGPQQPSQKKYEDVFNETSSTNTTVYLGNIMSGLTEELIRANFIEYGQIADVKIFSDKGYAFIRYETHEAATKAIVEKHGFVLNGYTARCSWGKESPFYDSSSYGYYNSYNNYNQSYSSYPPPPYAQNQPSHQYNGPYDTSQMPPPPSSGDNYNQYYQYCEQYYRQYYDQYYGTNGPPPPAPHQSMQSGPPPPPSQQQQQQQQASYQSYGHYGGYQQNSYSNGSYDSYQSRYPPPNAEWNQSSAPGSWN